jgi:hypothetical protein
MVELGILIGFVGVAGAVAIYLSVINSKWHHNKYHKYYNTNCDRCYKERYPRL